MDFKFTNKFKRGSIEVLRKYIHIGAICVLIFIISTQLILTKVFGLNIRNTLSASNYYVSTTGDDTNPGTTTGLPFRTLTKGVSVLIPGDTLFVMSGTYNESFNNSIPSGTDWTSPVTLKAYDSSNKPIIRPDAGADRVFFFGSSGGLGSHHIIVDGFVIDAVNVNIDAIKITYNGTIDTEAAHHIRIQNSEIKNAPRQGILTTGEGAQYNEFLNLSVHNNGATNQHHGFYISTSNNIISNCIIYSNAGYGVQIYNQNTWSDDNNTVKYSIIYDNGNAGSSGAGIILSSGSNHIAYNNIIYDNNEGVTIDYGALNAKVYNNTLYHNDKNDGLPKAGGGTIYSEANITIANNVNPTSGIVSSNPDLANNIIYTHLHYGIYNYDVSGAVIRNNLVNNNTSANIRAGTATISGNITNASPDLVNVAANDYHLNSTSSAKDAGFTLAEVTDDFEGNSRPQNSIYDIGAYEYTVQPSSTPTSTPTILPTPTDTPTPIPTVTSAPTYTPTTSPTDSPTPTPTDTIVPTNTPTPALTDTPIPSPTNTSVPTPIDILPTDTPIPTPTYITLSPTLTPTLESLISSPTSTSNNLLLLNIEDGQKFNSNKPTFTGSAAPNSVIEIEIHSSIQSGKTTTNSLGVWSFTPVLPLENGEHQIFASIIDVNGNKTLTIQKSFSIALNILPKTSIAFNVSLVLFGVCFILIGLLFYKRYKTI